MPDNAASVNDESGKPADHGTPTGEVEQCLADARAAVQRSDRMQLPTQQTRTLAVRDETQALRDAMRALIQAVEALNDAR